MPEDGVKRGAADLAALLHVKVGVIILQVGEALIPALFLDTAQLFTLDLGHDSGGGVGVLRRRGQLTQG